MSVIRANNTVASQYPDLSLRARQYQIGIVINQLPDLSEPASHPGIQDPGTIRYLSLIPATILHPGFAHSVMGQPARFLPPLLSSICSPKFIKSGTGVEFPV